jgi:phosphoribosylanthranilate isomerase
MSVKVKICGITNVADAIAAGEAGADVLGFVFHERSRRFLTIEAAAEIIRELPPHSLKAGVFVNAPEEFVSRAVQACGLNLLQFHGEETPEYCVGFGPLSIKAFRVRNGDSLNSLQAYNTDAWLLDTWSASQHGGTGERFDWALALQAQKFGRPIFLAGGLTPQNVAEAVRQVKPYGVDVSSGVEKAPGLKDYEKVRAFIAAAKEASQEQS